MSNLFYMKIQGHAIRADLFTNNSIAILARDALRVFGFDESQVVHITGSRVWITKQEFLSLLMYSVLSNNKSQFADMTFGSIKKILNEAEEELLEGWFSHETT